MTEESHLTQALAHLTSRSARGMVSRARLASGGLNRLLLREFARGAGTPGALLPDPVIEVAKAWEPAAMSLSALSPGLLSPDLVAALDRAEVGRLPADRPPYAHQLSAWRESLANDRSVLVTAGTGAGKTECFLIPILQDILANPRPGGGVRAILLYPLNALIESQRERLAAWAAGLGGRVRFALWNGETPNTEREAKDKSDSIELRSREKVRARPPEILVTNITMLEYLLLRTGDRSILQASAGGLRWIVLDEAHSYVGSQAAEMALLLRRVRAGFGVQPGQVRLMATSATIGGEVNATAKLRTFAAALAGRPEADIAVIEGRERQPELPPAGPDGPLVAEDLAGMPPETAGAVLAAHPRMQALRREMAVGGVPLTELARRLTGAADRSPEAVALLEAGARARWQGRALLLWRAHLFHRAQGGVWACPDPECPHRAPELLAEGAGWAFGAVWMQSRARCACGAPVFEVVACTDCGTAHLQGLLTGGAQPRLDPPDPGEGDDFALDAEPEEEDAPAAETGIAWLAPGASLWLAEDGRILDNAPPEGIRAWEYRLIELAEDRGCCDTAPRARLMGLRYGPAFLMGNAIGGVLEDLAPPDGAAGLPAGGRRALTFSDSRQGVARLAAKFQQEAERSLTRAFLWHAVQERPQADPVEVARLTEKISQMHAKGLGDFAAEDERRLAEISGVEAKPVEWKSLRDRLASHTDLTGFAGDIWRHRQLGDAIGGDPTRLAEMFLYRELFRRPRVQNNPETMGLLRLTFSALEERALQGNVPQPLAEAGIDADGWVGLAQTALDLVFRQNLAVDLPEWMVPLVAPRFGKRNSIHAATTRTEDLPQRGRKWPSPVPYQGRLARLAGLVYALTGGTPDSTADQDRVGVVLDALWVLIVSTAARDTGAGAYRLDFSRAAVVRLDRAWVCPVTRRAYGYHLSGRSPNDPARQMEEASLPRLPLANSGGLTPEGRAANARWAENDPQVAALRARGLWSDLHDRLAAFPPYVRAQEHSAQIARPTLKRYEQAFREGRINLLNCSTTMEMGVDLADVRLVVNANVPPALSNYRQRAGRAGRRDEPWAFTLTFCRDLPLDRRVADDPLAFLRRPIVAPRIWLESPSLVQRHVNAALLAAWLGEHGGEKPTGTIGAFLGAGTSADQPVLPDARADAFLADMEGGWGRAQEGALAPLVFGTALADLSRAGLVARSRLALEALVTDWRREHRLLLEGAEATNDPAARQAMELRAKRLAGDFLLGEIARRGFTPAYGFPTDVVTFANLAHRSEDDGPQARSYQRRGTAARPMDQAIREYAPGAELVIDGLVHLSEGILPAWQGAADASGLEDLRTLWSCPSCHAFGLEAADVQSCPACGQEGLDRRKVLRPAGFLGGRAAHVGYENLAFVPQDRVRVSAQGGDWRAQPDGAGRMRADPAGQIVASAGGMKGGGFAICLDCGRAEPMGRALPGISEPLSPAMSRHAPLFRGRGLRLTQDGWCPSANAPQRIQRHVHLAQVTRSDVWEWQLPEGATEPAARTLAAALREALAERLGVEPDEIAPGADRSAGPAGEARMSVFLHDRAAGGAGLAARMADPEMLAAALARAEELLNCPEGCRRGCPSCILRPDLNQRETVLDRPGALDLARVLRPRLDLPQALRLFGPQTRLAGYPASVRLRQAMQAGKIVALDLWLHGDPAEWDLAGWPLLRLLPRLADAGVRPRLHLLSGALTSAGFDLSRKLALHGLAQWADLHRAEVLPLAGGHPLLLRLEVGSEAQGVAVTHPAEALPRVDWGLGAASAAVIGPVAEITVGPRFSADRVISLGLGNARILRPDMALDGPVTGFGKRFWSWLAALAPLEVGALRAAGVVSLAYSDRYLLQAYTLRLLAEVMQTAPGAARAARSVVLARADRAATGPRFVYDGFESDAQRLAVLEALMPAAEIRLLPKSELPHHRALVAALGDGRRLTILLDQGFGGWRVADNSRHDFAAPAAAQARSLAAATFAVTGAEAVGAPLAVTFE